MNQNRILNSVRHRRRFRFSWFATQILLPRHRNVRSEDRRKIFPSAEEPSSGRIERSFAASSIALTLLLVVERVQLLLPPV